jgi:hypothetical protein
MNQTSTTLVIIAIIILVIGVRIWRSTREQRIVVGRMWIAPIVFAALTVWVAYVDGLVAPLDIALAALAIAVGGAIGMYQGTHTTIRIDRAAGAIYVKVKPIGIALFVAVIIARFVVRLSTGYPSVQSGSLAPGGMSLPPRGDLVSLISLLLLGIALGGVVGLRLYLFRKYHEPVAPATG